MALSGFYDTGRTRTIVLSADYTMTPQWPDDVLIYFAESYVEFKNQDYSGDPPPFGHPFSSITLVGPDMSVAEYTRDSLGTPLTCAGSFTKTIKVKEQVCNGRTNDADGFPVWDCQFQEVLTEPITTEITCDVGSLDLVCYTGAAGDPINETTLTGNYTILASTLEGFGTATAYKKASITITDDGGDYLAHDWVTDGLLGTTTGGEVWAKLGAPLAGSLHGTRGPEWKFCTDLACKKWSDPYNGMLVDTLFYDGALTETGESGEIVKLTSASGAISDQNRSGRLLVLEGSASLFEDTRPLRNSLVAAFNVDTPWMDGGENNWRTVVDTGPGGGTYVERCYDSLFEIDDPVVAPWTAFSLTKIASHSLTSNDLNARHFRYLQIPSGNTGSCTVSGQTTSIDAGAIEAGSGTTWVLTRDLNLLTPCSHVYTIPSSVGDYGEVVVAATGVTIDLACSLPDLYRLDGVSVSGSCNLVTNLAYESSRWAVDKLMQITTVTYYGEGYSVTKTTDAPAWKLYDTNPSTVGVISSKLYKGEQVTIETNGIRSLEYHTTDKIVDLGDDSFVYSERSIATLLTDMVVGDGWTLGGGTTGGAPYEFSTLWAHMLTPTFNSSSVDMLVTPRYSSVTLYPRNDWKLKGTKVFQGAVEGLIVNTAGGGAADDCPVSCGVAGSTNSQGWFYLHPVAHTTAITGHVGSTGGTLVELDTTHVFNPGGVSISLGHREMARKYGTAAYTWVLMAQSDGSLAAFEDGRLVAGKIYQ